MSAPSLPSHISSDGREIWAWARQMSAQAEWAHKVRELTADLRKPVRCGDCYNWMKSSKCPQERNENGRRRGPSMVDYPCSKFVVASHVIQRRQDIALRLSATLMLGPSS